MISLKVKKKRFFLKKLKNDIRSSNTFYDDNYSKIDRHRDRSVHNDTSSNIYISKDHDSDAKSDVEHNRVHCKQKIISFTMSNAIAVPIAKDVSITMTRTMLKAKVIVMTMTKSNNIMTELIDLHSNSYYFIIRFVTKDVKKTNSDNDDNDNSEKKTIYVMIFVMKIARIETDIFDDSELRCN